MREKKHLLDEHEWQRYCAFKCIEPQIKGCLDREREYEKQLAEKEKEIERLKHIERYDIGEMFLENAKLIIEKRQFAIQRLERVKSFISDSTEIKEPDYTNVCKYIDQIISEVKSVI